MRQVNAVRRPGETPAHRRGRRRFDSSVATVPACPVSPADLARYRTVLYAGDTLDAAAVRRLIDEVRTRLRANMPHDMRVPPRAANCKLSRTPEDTTDADL
jgi:hypothetical protein